MNTTRAVDIPLQQWVDSHIPDEKMFWQSSFRDQILFVRDRLPVLLGKSNRADVQYIRQNTRVISTHTSKSILLPVYSVTVPNGTIFTMRYNFYNWNVSVESRVDVWATFNDLFDEYAIHQSGYCEGFPDDKVFGSYASNQKRFTVELAGDFYAIYTFFWVYSRLRQGMY